MYVSFTFLPLLVVVVVDVVVAVAGSKPPNTLLLEYNNKIMPYATYRHAPPTNSTKDYTTLIAIQVHHMSATSLIYNSAQLDSTQLNSTQLVQRLLQSTSIQRAASESNQCKSNPTNQIQLR